MVLDLPAEVGTTMETSIYFWNQTAHGRPIPYTPDVRMGSARDIDTFKAFQGVPSPGGNAHVILEQPAVPDAATVSHIKETYGMIVLHPDLEAKADLSPSYTEVLTPAFGAPEEVDGLKIWRLH